MKHSHYVDIEKHRSLFLMIGFFMALLLVWLVMEWSTIAQPRNKKLIGIKMDVQEISFITGTEQGQPKKQTTKTKQLPETAAHMPQFVGGRKALISYTENNLRYPPQAKSMGIKGTVLVSFRVDEKGRVLHPKIIRSIHPLLDKEALRLVKKMPFWIPAKQPVRLTLCLPVCFR